MNSDSILSTIRTLESRLSALQATPTDDRREHNKEVATIQEHIENAYRALRLYQEAEAIMEEIKDGKVLLEDLAS